MNLKSLIWFAIHNHRRNKVVAKVARLCKNIHRASEHPGYDVNNNGERAVLERSVAALTPVLFDVGANVGEWSAMALETHPGAKVHAFELNPRIAEHLQRRFSEETVVVHPVGLAAQSGTVDFFAYEGDASVLSGMRVPLHSHVPHTVEKATVRTGNEVCAQQGIEIIDFLKVDAEGADFEVLKGFDDMLARQQIKVIQFEHEGGRYLRDFHDFLGKFDYAIGKLYANYVEFREHSAEMEHFLGPNYIAVPRENAALLATLEVGW